MSKEIEEAIAWGPEVEWRPCPFCGGEEFTFTTNNYGKRVVECDTCNAQGPSDPTDGDPKWNGRTYDHDVRVLRATIEADRTLAAEASMAWSILTGQDPQQTRVENSCVAAARDLKEKHDALVSAAKALCREVANHGEPKDEVLEALEKCRAALWRSES